MGSFIEHLARAPGEGSGAEPVVLVVDDEPGITHSIARLLSRTGMSADTARDVPAALGKLGARDYDVALVDVRLPGQGGFEILKELKRRGGATRVVMMTAFADTDVALESVRAGAYHFLTKPFRSDDEVIVTVRNAADHGRLARRASQLETLLGSSSGGGLGDMIGSSPAMQRIYQLVEGVAPTGANVLVLGETGSGKELTARAIHSLSLRATRPLITLNCAAIPQELVESELFGHVKGAFTGATTTRPGLFEAANGGTLFLDEIGDLPLPAQVKLLRALQQGEIKRVGSNEVTRVDVRVIAATHQDLRALVLGKRFREDLYYRLNVVALRLPALRERRDDIPAIAQHLLVKLSHKLGRSITRFSHDALQAFEQYPWPGNVRELENAIEHATVFCKDDVVTAQNLPPWVLREGSVEELADHDAPSHDAQSRSRRLTVDATTELPFKEARDRALAAFEREYLERLLDRTEGNLSEAARSAGLDRTNLKRALKRNGLRD